jgi:hypothetical protein
MRLGSVRRPVASVIPGQRTWVGLSMEYLFLAYLLTTPLEPPNTTHAPPESPR